MKVELIKQFLGDMFSYKIKTMDWCCEDLEKNPVINLVIDDEEVPIMGLEEEYELDSEGWTDLLYYPIKFCPFCGKPIEIAIAGEEDVSEEYKALQDERERLWKKIVNTDSKKKELELRKEVNRLDAEISKYHGLRG